jgi:SagB-type dehydrogenase family enzyme
MLAVLYWGSQPLKRPGQRERMDSQKEYKMDLPNAQTDGTVSLEKTIKIRRTIRSFTSQQLTLEQFSQLLWAAYGITEDRGYKRAAASGGACYPMDIYALVGEEGIKGMAAGIYHYEPMGHRVSLILEGDLREEMARASLGQMWMATPPLSLVVCAEYARITSRYGDRGVRYAIIEAGHVGQNIFLQAEAMGLGAGIVGAFRDEAVIQVMGTPPSHEPLLIMPVGHKG